VEDDEVGCVEIVVPGVVEFVTLTDVTTNNIILMLL
jgi:hypothetical protein